MDELLGQLAIAYPKINYRTGEEFCWSPETNEIVYNASSSGDDAIYSLLHETGHALLKHQNYETDFGLLKLEVAAWEKAGKIANRFGIKIDEDHIQDCLDTYRDWLHKRSICPNCSTQCLQQSDIVHYRCYNCHTAWRVSANRFCRAYRSTETEPSLAINS